MEVFEKANADCLTDKRSKTVFISHDVSTIESGAFCGFTAAREVVLPEEVEEIESWAFYECRALESINLHKHIGFIGENAFLDTAIYENPCNWQNGVLYLDDCLIKADETVKETCFVKDSTRLIARGAFKNCNLLERVYIPETVEKICGKAFEGCSKLKAIYGGVGSAAEKYAKENGIKFIAVEYN